MPARLKVVIDHFVPTWSPLPWWQVLKQRLGFKVQVKRCAYRCGDIAYVSPDTYAAMVKAGMAEDP